MIQAWIPVLLFAILFGLSMDYQVFLISRIRERYLQTGDNEEAVTYGLRSTAGLITGAALVMVAIFGGFAAGDLVPTAQFGFGMAVAILLDATIVRSVLVPSTMKLLGDRNWYLPGFLSWLSTCRWTVIALFPKLKWKRAGEPRDPSGTAYPARTAVQRCRSTATRPLTMT